MLIAVPHQVWSLTEFRSVVLEIGANFIGYKNDPVAKSSAKISNKIKEKVKIR